MLNVAFFREGSGNEREFQALKSLERRATGVANLDEICAVILSQSVSRLAHGQDAEIRVVIVGCGI